MALAVLALDFAFGLVFGTGLCNDCADCYRNTKQPTNPRNRCAPVAWTLRRAAEKTDATGQGTEDSEVQQDFLHEAQPFCTGAVLRCQNTAHQCEFSEDTTRIVASIVNALCERG
jgi:hypothetical protein